jgi:hypothetical protein
MANEFGILVAGSVANDRATIKLNVVSSQALC